MRLIILVIWTLVIVSCKTPYNYYSPTLNATPYAQQGEGHIGFNAGTIGIAAKGGVALTDRININGSFGGLPSADDRYKGHEGEISIGYQSLPSHKNGVLGINAGIGGGRNSNVSKSFSGNYSRPFLQLQYGFMDKAFLSKKVYYDGSVGMRLNYLSYNGVKNAADFDHDHFFYEPFFCAAIGSKNVRFEVIQGLAIKNARQWDKGVRVYPYFLSIGLLVKAGGRR